LHSSKSFPKGRQTLLSLLGTRKKNFSFHFKRNYLIIRAVKFCEFFCICSPGSLGQDPTIESAKNNNFKFIWASSARNGSFGVFFEKKGVKLAPLSWHPVHVCARHVGAWYMFAPDMFAPSTCSRPTCSRPCLFPHAPTVVPVGAQRSCVESHLRLPTATLAGNNMKSYCSKVNLEQ
jgi:hypothetical protein